MSLVRDTVRGALWTIGSGMGSRAIGLIGTLLITRLIAPAEYGEVTVAAVLGMTANQFSTIGWGQYLVSWPDAPRSMAFHVTVFHLSLGLVALLAPWRSLLATLIRLPLAGWTPTRVLAAGVLRYARRRASAEARSSRDYRTRRAREL